MLSGRSANEVTRAGWGNRRLHLRILVPRKSWPRIGRMAQQRNSRGFESPALPLFNPKFQPTDNAITVRAPPAPLAALSA